MRDAQLKSTDTPLTLPLPLHLPLLN